MKSWVARREPRGFTITDLLVVSLGYAICWSAFSRGNDDVVGLTFSSLVATPVVVGLVILFRQWRHGRPTRGTECSVLLCAAILIATAIPNIDTALDGLYPNVLDRPLTEWSFWRWTLAGVVTFVVSVCWALDWKRFPHWLRTLGGLVSVTAFFWGPLFVIYRHLDFLQFVRSIDQPYSLLDATLVEIQRATQPAPIHFAIFLTMAVTWNSFRTKRRRWTWIDWFSMLIGLMMTIGICTSQWSSAYGSEGVWLVAWAIWPCMVLIEAAAAFAAVRWMQRRRERQGKSAANSKSLEESPIPGDEVDSSEDSGVETAAKHDAHPSVPTRPTSDRPPKPEAAAGNFQSNP